MDANFCMHIWKNCTHTFWCRKKDRNEMHRNPMCWNIFKVLLADPPPLKIPNERSRFPAGIVDVAILMLGWLDQILLRCLQWTLLQVVSTWIIVPNSFISIRTSGTLQDGQTSNSFISCDRKTMYFGCFLRLLSLAA